MTDDLHRRSAPLASKVCLRRFAALLAVVLCSWTALANAESGDSNDRASWRFEFANDVAFGSDNQFTNGFSVQRHSPLADSLSDVDSAWGFGRGLAGRILPEGSGLQYRHTLAFGQNMATPDEIEDPNLILDDLPYLGMLALESSWIALNDEELTGFGLTFGIVGEYSFAEDVQEAVHSLIDSDDPEGWDNQLDDEPILQAYYVRKGKFRNTKNFDIGYNFDASLGNFHTGIDAGIEMRFGRKPEGFAYIPDPIGRNMTYDAVLSRPGQGQSYFYGSAGIRAWAWAVFMPLEGNTLVDGNDWTDDNTIDPENVIGQFLFGVHYERPRWALHFTVALSTDNVDSDSLSPDVENDFGWITFDWRF